MSDSNTAVMPIATIHVEDGRMVYYRTAPDEGFWERHWREILKPEVYRMAEQGDLDLLQRPLIGNLPRDKKILEAGCGMGQIVVALRARGYDCEGMDFSESTVKAVRNLRPELPIRVCDLLAIDTPAAHYGAYISVGVVEHRREGPDPFLTEAHRVLCDDGALLLSVPYFNALRRIKARLGAFRRGKASEEFYQYAFTRKEFQGFLERAGFRVLGTHAYAGTKGLKDEIPPFRFLLRWRFFYRVSRRLFRSFPFLGKPCAHMIMFNCRKI